ncbi:SOS response-associated peptidase [Kordiimonas sp. SCSIO 12610]|nr:SOS response-associated peptidase [Kordiimonas sp. SCSIO 12610]
MLTSDQAEIAALFGVQTPHMIPERYNIAPTQPVLVIREADTQVFGTRGARELAALEWNFVPEWAKEKNTKPLINARVETIEAKPSFRSSIKRRRCLVPFNGWYEWKSVNGKKQPYFIQKVGANGLNELAAFAGVWSTWHGPDGEFWLETFAIITAEATGPLRATHHRKPLVVKPADYDRWLMPHDPLPPTFLKSFDWEAEGAFHSKPVSTRVNSIRFDDPACLNPPEEEKQPSLF